MIYGEKTTVEEFYHNADKFTNAYDDHELVGIVLCNAVKRMTKVLIYSSVVKIKNPNSNFEFKGFLLDKSQAKKQSYRMRAKTEAYLVYRKIEPSKGKRSFSETVNMINGRKGDPLNFTDSIIKMANELGYITKYRKNDNGILQTEPSNN